MFYSAEPSDEEDEAVDENEEYTACYEATIDDCINSLHTPAHYTAAELSRREIEFEYDWLLDGSEDEDEGPLNKTKRRRQRRYGDSDLDQTICMLELEHASYTSSTGGSTCVSVGENSVNDNDSASSGHEETIEFIGIGAQTAAAGFANFADFSALDQPDEVLQRDVLYEYVEKKEPHEENDNANQLQTNCQVRSFIDGYNPPQSIECLVETLESELDVTIKTCLSVAENQDSDMVELDRVAHESQVSQVDVQCAPKESNEESAQRQSSSLMSDVLLKTLPLPMPNSTSDDRVASFTRRLQNEHCSSSAQTGLYDDDALERKLSRTIYSGYFDDSSSTQKSDQDKDVHSIVLDEILSVPWPFHQIDLDNSIFSNEHSESDSDSQNCLDFDPYISNRLSELDSAFRDVMEVAAARVGKKEETLNHEVNLVFDSLMQVETALMFIAETRKLVLSASQGYTVEDSVHDVISCRMDVVRFAEKKEILQDLLDAIDHVSIVKEREADWWHRLQRGEPFESMVNDTRQLLVMIEGEESLVRLSCLEPMRLRIRELPHLLLQTIEESLTSFLGTIISAQEKIDFDRAKNQYLGLFRSWCLCYRMILDILPSGVKAETIKAEWLTTYLRAFRFHIRRATACAVIDSFGDENVKSAASDVGAAHDLGAQLDQSKLDSVVDSLCQRLFELRFTTSSDGNALSSTFYHLCSRHVEILSLHSTILRWHGSKDGGISDSSGNSVSSVSSTSSSCTEGSTLSQDSEAPPVPGGLQFAFIDVQSVLRSNQASLYISCEESILSFAEGYMEMKESGNLLVSDATTDSLSSIHGISKQFQDFALHFFRNNDDDSRSSGIQPSKSCAIEDCLAKLYDSHLRSVHIEAMKTTGTLLRHEPWQLSPIELNSGSRTADPTLRTYEAVADLLNSYIHRESPSREDMKGIEERSKMKGFGNREFRLGLKETEIQRVEKCADLKDLAGLQCDAFKTILESFVELKPCGQQSISLLTSSATSLVKWIGRLLMIARALPLLECDASSAMMTLFDLYVLTVFRYCAGNQVNEDVILFGRDTADYSPAGVSFSVEADTVSPTPSERRQLVKTQQFLEQSRKRISAMVNLDKFQSSSDGCPTSPRSKNVTIRSAMRLEREVAACCSCLFVSMLADVARSTLCGGALSKEPLWDDLKDLKSTLSMENRDGREQSLREYVCGLTAATPHLLTLSVRLAAAEVSFSKQVVFEVLCVRSFEEHVIQEQSNTYVFNLCERSAIIWGYLSSSMCLPPPILVFTWDQIVRVAFLILIEAFSKVSKCTTEGRSLMSMDLATLSHGLMPDTIMEEISDDYGHINPPPNACRTEMMMHVDTFVKVFYYPDSDKMSWIKENLGNYHLQHFISLLSSRAEEIREMYKLQS